MQKTIFFSLSMLLLPITNLCASETNTGSEFDDYLKRLARNPDENATIISQLSEELQIRLAILQSAEESRSNVDQDEERRRILAEQERRDAEYVQQLLMGEKQERDAQRLETERRELLESQYARDEELARQLSQVAEPIDIESNGNNSSPASSPVLGGIFNENARQLTSQQRDRIVEMKDCLVDICQRLAQAGSMNQTHLDVHEFNALVRQFSELCVALNQVMGLNANIDYQTAITKLRALDRRNEYAAEINKLNGYLQQSHYEEETNLNSHHALSFMVDYLERMGNEEDIREFFLRMRENTITAGGCYPGYIGRILAFNMRIVLHRFTNVRISTQ